MRGRNSLPPLLPRLWVPCSPLHSLLALLSMAPSSDVAVYYGGVYWDSTWGLEEVVFGLPTALVNKLACAGFQVGDDLWSPESRVLVLYIAMASIYSSWFVDDLAEIMAGRTSRGTTVIPVFLNVEPSELQDVQHGPLASAIAEWKQCAQDLGSMYDLRKFRVWADAVHQVSSITGHELARYHGDGDKLKYEVLIEVSRVINTGRIAEFNEVWTQNQLFKQQVSDNEEEARQARRMVISHLKVLAGELLKHAMDNVCSTSSHMTSQRGKPSRRFTSKVHYREIRKVAKRFSIRSREFARVADRCIDARNKVAHCHAVDWRRSSALPDAVKFINRYPDVKNALPDQCEIILGYKDICSEFRL